jgi:hypothetical protein
MIEKPLGFDRIRRAAEIGKSAEGTAQLRRRSVDLVQHFERVFARPPRGPIRMPLA